MVATGGSLLYGKLSLLGKYGGPGGVILKF